MTPEFCLAAANTSCPKSLVFREQQALLRPREFDDGLIVRTGHLLGDRDDIITGQPEIGYY